MTNDRHFASAYFDGRAERLDAPENAILHELLLVGGLVELLDAVTPPRASLEHHLCELTRSCESYVRKRFTSRTFSNAIADQQAAIDRILGVVDSPTACEAGSEIGDDVFRDLVLATSQLEANLADVADGSTTAEALRPALEHVGRIYERVIAVVDRSEFVESYDRYVARQRARCVELLQSRI